MPENALLSHDLFEGLHARVALVSDVELVDEYPSSVLSHARRQHRWIRGDWQILFWLFPFVPSQHGLKRNTLPLIGRWKILDNLRRSLVCADAAGAARRRVDGAARPRVVLDDGGDGRRRVAAPAGARAPARRARPGAVDSGVPPQPAPRCRHRAGAGPPQPDVSRLPRLRYRACDRRHARAPRRSRSGGCWSGRRPRPRRRRAAGLVGQRLRRFVAEMVASPIIAAAVAAGDRRCGDRRRLPAAAPFLLLWTIAPVVAYWLSVPVGARVRPLSDRERTRAAPDGAQDLALLRDVRHRSRRLAAARQLSGGRRRAEAGAPHVAHQHRHEPAVDAGRARPRLSVDRRAASAASTRRCARSRAWSATRDTS